VRGSWQKVAKYMKEHINNAWHEYINIIW
jgi:hypothetical protein